MIRQNIAIMAILAVAALASTAAQACGPNEEWYRDVSDVVFDGRAHCTLEERTCRITASRVLKNRLNLHIQSRSFDVDFQNWYADNPVSEDQIVMRCGYPLFEPDQERFRARFYANLDEETGELVMRTHLPEGRRQEETE